MERIYLDHAATSPIHKDVVQVMADSLKEFFGNPSSIHHYGREARRMLDDARETIATSIHAKSDEIVFTSGGTEADNLAIIGYAKRHRSQGTHLITVKTEHHGVLHACEHLERDGFDVTYLNVDEDGMIRMDELQAALRDDTILVSIMMANNETGVLLPIKEIGDLLKDHQAVFHTDAVQAIGKYPIHVDELHIDLLASSAHKFNGPNGVGFLYKRKGITLDPLTYGGEQERKTRAGTENVAGILGMAKALSIAIQDMHARSEQYEEFREQFLRILDENAIEYKLNGHKTERLNNVMNLSFEGMNVESILMNLDLSGVAVSSGSACTAGSVEPSHVLTAMFGNNDRSKSAVRFSFGLGNTIEQVIHAANAVVKTLERMNARR
ncbi:cysteine desulfurase [Paenalkalicoccus suaedae]|uniref:cysteine desulfurase n=1 Tax=Paenalkalicoccus suaedae TaxID=2592382 RepID=A0A859FD99_9BACI|nr:cysteine desulfurase family protein [Paenalkalicoccus suaedae]QKS70791.1 cysteine desulfurase [Paenalkalicoccus suaedae]